MSLDFTILKPCAQCGHVADKGFNITHNLTAMAKHAGVYKCLWRPSESGFETAEDIAPLLEKGIKDMEAYPEQYVKYNAKNGWGTYEHFLPWLKMVLMACKEFPKGEIEASR